MIQVGSPIGGKPPMVPMGMVTAKELELLALMVVLQKICLQY